MDSISSSISLLSVNTETSTFTILVVGAIILLLLVGSALASASEVSFFSLSPNELTEIEKLNGAGAKTAIRLLEQPKKLLALILVLNNFFNVSIVILGAYLSSLAFPLSTTTEFVKFLIDVFVITFILLLFGEVIPKIYATKHGKRVLLLMALPIYYFGKIPPFNWIVIGLVKGTAVINNLGKKKGVNVSSAELSHALELTIEEETDVHDQKILEGIVKFGKKDVKQIMMSRVDVHAVDIEMNYHQLYQKIVNCGFSRIPVYRESFDTIEGILFVKDLLPYLEEKDDFKWQDLVREPYFVPENKKIDDLLKSFQERKVHMAVVVDEYGGTSGIVTLEDVLEEIVGDISDEYDDEDLTYSKLDDFNYVFEGKTLLVDLYKVLEIDGREFEEVKSEADSIGGFVTEQAGKILKRNDELKFSSYLFKIESADARKVKRIKITLLPIESDENE